MHLLKLKQFFQSIKLSQLALKHHNCPLCGFGLLIKLYNNEMGVRCLKCKGSAVSQSLAYVFYQLKHKQISSNNQSLKIYELSSRGAWFRSLNNTIHQLTFSEYFDGVPLGEFSNGTQCQDVQKLTFPDSQFNVCTSLEVFEHVEDDIKGFSEVIRVLKPGGFILFTVPLSNQTQTIERTAIINGKRQQILPAEYHSDSLRGVEKVFCYRNYGSDVVDRLLSVGFESAEIIKMDADFCFGFGRPVIVAHKPK